MTEEIWKDIPEYGRRYQASNLGRIRSTRAYGQSNKPKILSQYKINSGYYAVHLNYQNVPTHRLVHRLVASAFIPNPENLPQVNHKNENKLDNSPENLEWCSRKYNINFGTGRKRHLEKLKVSTFVPVKCIETGKIFESQIEAARATGCRQSTINNACYQRNNTHTAGGYHWKIISKEEFYAENN